MFSLCFGSLNQKIKQEITYDVLIFPGDRPIEFDFFRKVDKYMGPQLSSIASDIAELTTKKTSRFLLSV